MDFGGLHTDFGDSSRITEINALLGLIQLKKLPQMLNKRQRAYEHITSSLDKAEIEYVSTKHMDIASQYKLMVRLPEGKKAQEIKPTLAAEGVLLGGTVYELPCHHQPVFKGICDEETYPVAEQWCPNHICPPLTSGMSEEQARFVGEALARHLGNL